MDQIKKILPWVVVLALGYWAGSHWTGSRKEEAFQQLQQVSQDTWAAERAQLEKDLAEARNKPPRIQVVYKEVPEAFTNKLTPQQILEKLINLKPNEYETYNQTFRKVVYYMHSLQEAGPYAFPVIRDFLAQNVDVDYSQFEVKATGERVRGTFASRNLVRTDFLVPPSLRLGLLGVLGQIGGDEAEMILADTLATSARGVEVAYLARLLQEIRPNHYSLMALQAAQDLLANPPPFEDPNYLDENAKAFLYEVLKMYNDTSFAGIAQSLLVTPEGRVDQNAIEYLDNVLHDQAMPAIQTAYADPRLTNRVERSRLLNAALVYTGPNQAANEMFAEMVMDPEVPAGLRAYTVQSLAGSSKMDPPKEEYVIKTRIQLLNNLRATLEDERILRSVESTIKSLERLLMGQSAN